MFVGFTKTLRAGKSPISVKLGLGTYYTILQDRNCEMPDGYHVIAGNGCVSTDI